MKINYEEVIALPQGVSAALDSGMMHIKGPKGDVSRRMSAHGVTMRIDGQQVKFVAKKASKREKKMLYTFIAHVKNMIRGVQQPWVYKLKICSGHFPMTATLTGQTFALKNFLGEKVPRTCTFPQGVEVKLAGAEITITSVNRELAGQSAGLLELLTFKPKKDQRTFQDGIYITEKPSKEASA